jgi:hypothetical protein
MLTTKDYEFAMLSQGAVNLSGLVRSLAEVTERIWAEAHAKGQGTEYVNTHPIVRLYVEQITFLCRTPYHEAHEAVAREITDRKAGVESA